MGEEMTITLPDLKSAWKLRNMVGGTTVLLKHLKAKGLGLSLQTQTGRHLRLLPQPNLLVRLLVPAFRDI